MGEAFSISELAGCLKHRRHSIHRVNNGAPPSERNGHHASTAPDVESLTASRQIELFCETICHGKPRLAYQRMKILRPVDFHPSVRMTREMRVDSLLARPAFFNLTIRHWEPPT
jgi:hypothetical protein